MSANGFNSMPQLTIQTRLNLLIGTLLVLALAANIAVIVWSAGPRIRAEDGSILRLAVETVERSLSELEASQDPARDVAGLLDRLSRIRHAIVYLEPPATRPIEQNRRVATGTKGAPAWFARMLYSDRPPVRLPVVFKGTRLGTIVIAANPADEIAEIWEAAAFTFTAGLALITAVFALTTWVVRRSLLPVQNLVGALRVMQGGDYAVKLDETGPPELAEISGKLNILASALQRSRDDNSRLTGQIITLQDQERRELARELHDEFGPYLFAVRASLSAMQAEAEREGTKPSLARATKCKAALDQVSALQQLNRHVLQRLRPPALTELGLDGALHGLVANWRANNANIAISLDSQLEGQNLDSVAELTVYRVVQEGLTNAFRHAHATLIRITIKPQGENRIGVCVADDGKGVSEGAKPGFGLSGMGDRVRALGGTIKFTTPPAGGFALDVSLPIETGAAGS